MNGKWWMITGKKDVITFTYFSVLPEDHGEEGHPDVEPILRLAEVGGPRVRVELRRYLKDPGQGVEDGHLGLGVMHRLVVHHVVLTRLLVRLGRGEALLLDPGDVEHVRLRNGLLQSAEDGLLHAVRLDELDDVLRHFE